MQSLNRPSTTVEVEAKALLVPSRRPVHPGAWVRIGIAGCLLLASMLAWGALQHQFERTFQAFGTCETAVAPHASSTAPGVAP